jgi:hypothetical protein
LLGSFLIASKCSSSQFGQKQKHFLLFVGFMRECVADGATKVAAKVAPSASASDLVAHHKMQVIAWNMFVAKWLEVSTIVSGVILWNAENHLFYSEHLSYSASDWKKIPIKSCMARSYLGVWGEKYWKKKQSFSIKKRKIIDNHCLYFVIIEEISLV